MKRLKQVNSRVKKLIFAVSALLLFTGIIFPANGQTTILEGVWNIESVKIKKTVNGVVSENTYAISESFDMFAECPAKITFTSDNQIIVERKGKSAGRKPSVEPYTVEGNIISRMASASIISYKYEITETNKIQLLYFIDYYYNHGQNRIDKITEECTFYGTRK